jgi:hypothetical protein
MTDINSNHPLWEPAARLYEAWMQAGGLSTLFSETFECAPPKLQLQWIGIAQVAKDLFAPPIKYDELADMDPTAAYTSQPVEELVIDGSRNDLGRGPIEPQEGSAQKIINELVGGPPGLTKSWGLDSFPLSTADRLAHARIDALQREVVTQLTDLWTKLVAEVAKSKPSLTEIQDCYNRIWGIFKEADDNVKAEVTRFEEAADAH